MTINLDDAGTIATILAGAAGFAAFLFAVLRYLIRAETAELRTNGGSTIKDTVHRVDERSEKTEKKADAIDKKLDEHIADAKERVERGDRVENELREALSNLANAIPTIAASTPPEQQS